MVALAAGTELAGHRIEALLGRGGMGVVYEARQLSLDRVVALKVIAPELVEDPDIRVRFLKEARAAASFEHPNVIPVYTAGEEDGVAFIAMRLIKGRDLRTLVRREGALAPERAAGIVAQAASALDAIHEAGFVHRDVKPANLLVDATGHIYLTDFGLVKHLLTRSGASRTGSWVGTLDYVSPEQIRGGRIDARADIYALGGVLHYMLTGHVPFEHEGEEAKLWAQLREPPPVPSSRRAGLPPELDAVVARAMAKEPDARHPSAGDLGRAAVAGAEGASPSQPERMVARGAAAPEDAPVEPGIAAEARTQGPPVTPPPRRRRAPLLAGAAGLVAAAALVLVLLQGGGDAQNQAIHAPIATAPPATPTSVAIASPAPTATPPPLPRIVKTIHGVSHRPSHIVFADGYAWVIGYYGATAAAIDLHTGRKRAVHPLVGLGATDIVADGDAVWVASLGTNTVTRIDARTGRVSKTLGISQPTRLAIGRSGLWIGARAPGPDVIYHYNRDGSSLLGTVSVPAGVGPMALSPAGLWVAGRSTKRLFRVDPKSNTVAFTLGDVVNATDLRYAGGYLWIPQSDGGSLQRYRPKANVLVQRSAGTTPSEVEVTGNRVYVTSQNDNALLVLSRRSLRPAHKPIPLPFNPYGIGVAGDELWVTSMGTNSVVVVRYR